MKKDIEVQYLMLKKALDTKLRRILTYQPMTNVDLHCMRD